MSRLLPLLADYWLLAALVAVVLVAVARVGFGQRPRLIWPTLALLLIGGHFLFANVRVGGMPAWELAGWTALAVAGVFLLAIAYLLLTGFWSRRLALVLGVFFAITLGGLVATAQAGGVSVVRSLRTIQFVQPWWLLLALVIPLIVWFSHQSLAGLGPVRRWVALSVRCLLVLLLVLALAEPRLRRPNENVCVL